MQLILLNMFTCGSAHTFDVDLWFMLLYCKAWPIITRTVLLDNRQFCYQPVFKRTLLLYLGICLWPTSKEVSMRWSWAPKCTRDRSFIRWSYSLQRSIVRIIAVSCNFLNVQIFYKEGAWLHFLLVNPHVRRQLWSTVRSIDMLRRSICLRRAIAQVILAR